MKKISRAQFGLLPVGVVFFLAAAAEAAPPGSTAPPANTSWSYSATNYPPYSSLNQYSFGTAEDPNHPMRVGSIVNITQKIQMDPGANFFSDIYGSMDTTGSSCTLTVKQDVSQASKPIVIPANTQLTTLGDGPSDRGTVILRDKKGQLYSLSCYAYYQDLNNGGKIITLRSAAAGDISDGLSAYLRIPNPVPYPPAPAIVNQMNNALLPAGNQANPANYDQSGNKRGNIPDGITPSGFTQTLGGSTE
jgi:hypothetical protein